MEAKRMALDPRDLLTTAEWLIAAGTLMTAIVVGIRKLYRLARNVEDSLDKIRNVEKLLTPNGGSSLYDRVARVEHNTENNAILAGSVAERIAAMASEQQVLHESVRDIHARLHSLEEIQK